eukprot:4150099-Amphidinium_carterae.3
MTQERGVYNILLKASSADVGANTENGGDGGDRPDGPAVTGDGRHDGTPSGGVGSSSASTGPGEDRSGGPTSGGRGQF